MAGLTRKKITVKTKRGKTYQRSMMVAAGGKAPPKKARTLKNGQVEKDSHDLYAAGLKHLGRNLGAKAGWHAMAHTDAKTHNMGRLAGILGGAAAGHHVGAAVAKHTGKKLSADRRAQLGLGAAVLGTVAGMHSAYKAHQKMMSDITKHGITYRAHPSHHTPSHLREAGPHPLAHLSGVH